MAKSSIDLEEVRENIAYVMPHVSSAGGYKSLIILLEPDENGQPRCVECTNSVAEVAKKYRLDYLRGNIAVNLDTVARIEEPTTKSDVTNYMAYWMIGNERFGIPVQCDGDQVNKVLARLRDEASDRVTQRAMSSRSRHLQLIA
ncbi:MAG: hypothetical protein K2Q32_00225 [Alphaproteobacteria bacterium]|nr:hypothetical protein [Alphaproteobacteria bacterium]